MADSSEKPIQGIAPGDMVMAFDPTADNGLGARAPARVRRTFQNVTKRIINLRGLRLTPGHVVLSDNGEWLKIVEALKQDRAMVEEREGGPVLVRARTGAAIGSVEDTPITVAFEDGAGFPHKAMVRAGIFRVGRRRTDGNSDGWSLARVLRHQNHTILPDGILIAEDGKRFNATPWPDGTPFDTPFQHDWVVSLDDAPFTPEWLADVAAEEEGAAEAVNERPFRSRRTPSGFATGLNRKERRRLASLRVVN
jgi:hypothetical protein